MFSNEASALLTNLYSNTFGNGHMESYWKCAYHGRSKEISLYVVGCADKFSGLLILNQQLYSVMPIGGGGLLKVIIYTFFKISSIKSVWIGLNIKKS